MSRKWDEMLEREIAKLAIIGLLKAGYRVDVQDGEEIVARDVKTPAEALAVMFSTDEDNLLVSKPDVGHSFVHFVWGNVQDVISDYGVSLEEALKPAIDYANKWD